MRQWNKNNYNTITIDSRTEQDILQEIKQKTGRDALSTAYFGTIHKNRDINNCIQRFRACLKNHSRNLHAPLCGIFCSNSIAVVECIISVNS